MVWFISTPDGLLGAFVDLEAYTVIVDLESIDVEVEANAFEVEITNVEVDVSASIFLK